MGFELLPGQRFETLAVAPLIEGVGFGGLIADKAFDVDWILAELDARGAEVVVSQHPRRTQPRRIDLDIYKWRHLMKTWMWARSRIRPTASSGRIGSAPVPSRTIWPAGVST